MLYQYGRIIMQNYRHGDVALFFLSSVEKRKRPTIWQDGAVIIAINYNLSF